MANKTGTPKLKSHNCELNKKLRDEKTAGMTKRALKCIFVFNCKNTVRVFLLTII